jgi:hypothetical protein
MTRPDTGRDGANEAFIVDRYLDSLLARGSIDPTGVPAALQRTAHVLAFDLPRYHPSFRFEEGLAARLAAVATGAEVPQDAAHRLIPFPLPATERGGRLVVAARPVVIGSVLTSAALSIAGAAYVAWRRNRHPAQPMVRAMRAVARGKIA